MRPIVLLDCDEVDLAAGRLSKRGTTLRLRDQSFRVLAALMGQAGRTAEARAVLQQLQAAVDRQNDVPPTSLAFTCPGLGEIDNAFVWLDRAVDVSDRMMAPILLYPFFDPLRGDPRFAELLRRMKLKPTERAPRSPVPYALHNGAAPR